LELFGFIEYEGAAKTVSINFEKGITIICLFTDCLLKEAIKSLQCCKSFY